MESALLWATAIGGCLTALATIGLVIVAGKTLGGAKTQLNLLREQAVREGRPYVVAEVVPGLQGGGFSDLVVANTGRTIAHDVTIDVGPLTKRTDDDHISDALHTFLSTPRSLAPGSRRRVMWRMEPSEHLAEAGADRSGISGKIEYSDADGNEYVEDYDLSVDTLHDATPLPTQGPTVNSPSLTKTDTELANISRAIRTLNTHVGELRR